MTAVGPPGDVPAPDEVLRPAGPDDLEALVALEEDCFDRPWSRTLIQLEVDNPPSLVLVAPIPAPGVEDPAPGDALAGYAAFREIAGEAELLRVAVRPGARNRGLGRRLVEAGLAAVRRRGAERCFLEVRTGNRPAIALYRRLGFTTVGRRERYYLDGSDALVMALDL